ncbi:MAG: pyridoxamine 5'-phosphate oxidase family protein [Candidatus Omnitrophota bacterium]|nr:pyridoxamine 5'-phosphate oxidase family protein [Candidatus Omnitrophota bacterium]
MLSKELIKLLETREFISIATCDFKGRPNAAPKFLLKTDNEFMYLVDYTISTTWRNLKINPRASMSLIDPSTLKGYQLNGTVKIIEKGPKYKKMRKEMLDKEIRLTAKHIIDDVRGTSKHESFEVVITENFVIFEVRITEVVEIGIKGELKRFKSKDWEIGGL